MKARLSGKKVAILVADGFEQVELTSPKEASEKAGAETDIISPSGTTVKAWDETKWGKTFKVDVPLKRAKPDDYDALILPGGVMNPPPGPTGCASTTMQSSWMKGPKPLPEASTQIYQSCDGGDISNP